MVNVLKNMDFFLRSIQKSIEFFRVNIFCLFHLISLFSVYLHTFDHCHCLLVRVWWRFVVVVYVHSYLIFSLKIDLLYEFLWFVWLSIRILIYSICQLTAFNFNSYVILCCFFSLFLCVHLNKTFNLLSLCWVHKQVKLISWIFLEANRSTLVVRTKVN